LIVCAGSKGVTYYLLRSLGQLYPQTHILWLKFRRPCQNFVLFIRASAEILI